MTAIGEGVGDRIRLIRERKGWTQDKLANETDISKGFISDVENGKRDITSSYLLKIANALNASLDYLMRGESQENKVISPVEIPAELSVAAQRLKLSYTETLALLRTKESVVAERSHKRKRSFTVDDWVGLYERLKDFLKK